MTDHDHATFSAKKNTKDTPWYHEPVLIVIVMVAAALFLAFPLLWTSPRFSLGAKIFWTIFVLIETVLLLWGVWWSLSLLWNTIEQLR